MGVARRANSPSESSVRNSVTIVRDAPAASTLEMMHAEYVLNGQIDAHAILRTDELVDALPGHQDE
jgi:hypothetical protein